MKERQLEIDILRGLAMLLVLLGHMIPWEGTAHNIIYSFHVPLFFFLSGYLMPEIIEDVQSFIRKNAERLLVPYALTIGIMALWACIKAIHSADWNEIPRMLLSYLWGGNISGKDCLPLGPIWFLLALFWSKTIIALLIRFLRSGWILPIALVVSVIGFVLNDLRYIVPLQIILSLQVVGMVAIGWFWRHKGFPIYIELGAVCVWIAMIFYGQMDVFTSTYSCLPFNIIGAFGASYILLQLCRLGTKLYSWITTPFAWLGKNSLLLLCCHQLECFSGICITAWIQWQIHYFLPGWLHILAHIGVNIAMVGMALLVARAYKQLTVK